MGLVGVVVGWGCVLWFGVCSWGFCRVCYLSSLGDGILAGAFVFFFNTPTPKKQKKTNNNTPTHTPNTTTNGEGKCFGIGVSCFFF